ncbi:MutS protein msh5 [Rhizopus azygosporus]|uniref:MutS protein msh5 n=1 Tax=Rhizopus azygosporus TaxID=86630 RepID=A0A367JEV5_RHIAZ|nr:MutS protein msh5 [Rhizopus azygosporus]
MESIACIQLKGNKLGYSFYSGETLKLYVMEDALESNDFSYTDALITQFMLKSILIPDSSSDEFVNFLQGYDETIMIRRIATKEFAFDKGRYTVLNWYIDYVHSQQDNVSTVGTDVINYNMILVDPEQGNKTHSYLQLEGLINLNESQLTIGCAGVLLKHIRKHEQQNVDSVDESRSSLQPTFLEVFSSDAYMHVSLDVARSLSIFEYDSHPNMHQKRGKEGHSLFGLLNKTKSILGQYRLKEWVMRPTTIRKTIEERHAFIEFLIRSDVREELQELRSYLSQIKNIHRLLSKVKEHKATPNDWQHILKFAYYSICIFGLLSQIQSINSAEQLPIFQSIQDHTPDIEDMKVVGTDINNLIDFEASKHEGRNIIKGKLDAELDFLKSRYENMDTYLLEVAQEIGSNLPHEIKAALNVVYFPQLGYLIVLPKYRQASESGNQSNHSQSTAISDDPYLCLSGFELQFTTADSLYYKNERTKELDRTIGDIHSMITDKEIEIIQGLSERVLGHTKQFSGIADILSSLDCLASLAIVALKFNYTKPKMTDTNELKIVQGRHPLQELCVDVFIPNDTHLEGGKGFEYAQDSLSLFTKSVRASDQNEASKSISTAINSIQVVTGANFSGKSVYLKQVALITYMAHIGSFVPAQETIIGITDRIYTRIQTLETILKPQSAFAYDLQQLKKALHNSTSRSLVIIDEFGKGTESTDGASLFCSVLGYFLSMTDNCPKVLASTHFHDVISQNILSIQDRITLSQTEILYQELSEIEGEPKKDEAVFLYRIVPGNSYLSSFGIWCAGIAGLPISIVERALLLSEKYAKGDEIDRIESTEEHKHFEDLEFIARTFVTSDINEINPRMMIESIKHLLGRD